MIARRTLRGVFSLSLALLAGVTRADAERVDRFGPFSRESSGAGEFSSTPYNVNLQFVGRLRVAYHAPKAHCSPILVRIELDDQSSRVTAPIAPGQDSEPIDFGRQAPGVHRLSVSAEGIPGGCNVGRLSSWGGTLTLWIMSGEPASTIELAKSLRDVVFAVEKMADVRGRADAFEYIDPQGAVHRSAGGRPRQPISDDGYYGADWLRAELAAGSIVSHLEQGTLAPYQSLARALAGRLSADKGLAPPTYRPHSITTAVYVWEAACGAYRRIVLSERGQTLWSSPPPPHWEEGSKEAAALSAWLMLLDDGARDR